MSNSQVEAKNNFNDWNIFNPCEEIMEPKRKAKEPMNNLPSNVMKCFFWEKEAVRTLIINGDPWFVGKDVAQILGYSNPSKALIDHVDDEDKLNNKSLSSLGQRGGWIINESGLYSLISSSQLPTAKRFKHWVTSEVLPAIRKTGGYFLGEEHMTEDELILAAMNVLQRKVEAYRI